MDWKIQQHEGSSEVHSMDVDFGFSDKRGRRIGCQLRIWITQSGARNAGVQLQQLVNSADLPQLLEGYGGRAAVGLLAAPAKGGE